PAPPRTLMLPIARPTLIEESTTIPPWPALPPLVVSPPSPPAKCSAPVTSSTAIEPCLVWLADPALPPELSPPELPPTFRPPSSVCAPIVTLENSPCAPPAHHAVPF